jgi:hypothetical protein
MEGQGKGKRTGPRPQRDANALRVRTSARAKGGENAGLLSHLSPVWHTVDEAARGPFIVQGDYLQVETASAKGDKW